MPFQPIDAVEMSTVTGGNMQWSGGLMATLDSADRKRRVKPADPMPQAVTAIGAAVSNLTTAITQSKQQSSQAMMQMLPQMMQR